MVKEKDIWNVLEKIRDPELGVSIVKMGMIKKVELKGDAVYIECELTTPACPLKKEIEDSIRSELSRIEGIRNVEIKTTAKVLPSRRILPEDILPSVKNIIAIGRLKRGLNVYENEYPPEIIEYDYVAYWHFPPNCKIKEVEMKEEYEIVNDRILVIYGNKGKYISG